MILPKFSAFSAIFCFYSFNKSCDYSQKIFFNLLILYATHYSNRSASLRTSRNSNLNEKTTWKHLGYVTGTEEITLPDEFEELYITVNDNRVKNNTVWADLFTIVIPNVILSDISKQFVLSSSSGTGSTDFTVQARVNKNVAKLETCKSGTTNYSSTATFDVCYR